VATVFAAFLGYNPIAKLLGPAILAKIPAANAHYLIGRFYFPHLISKPFGHGLTEAFIFAAIACLVAAVASWLRGGKYTASDIDPSSPTDEEFEHELDGTATAHDEAATSERGVVSTANTSQPGEPSPPLPLTAD
jgi:hypothetical protein